MADHNAHMAQLFDTLKAEGITENTLVVWISDNGPMYAFYPNSGYSCLKDGKGAIRYEDFKVHITEGHGGLIGMVFNNVMRDPGEKYGELNPGLFEATPIQIILREHMKMNRKFPHRVSEIPQKGVKLTPIEPLRIERQFDSISIKKRRRGNAENFSTK